MPTLRRYVARQFGSNMALMLLAFVSLLQLLDLLANADDIVKLHGGGAAAFFWHALFNSPEIISVVTPICALLASLLTLARLAHSNEVLALKAAGLSYYRLLVAFVPVAFAVGAAHFLVSDQLTPPASRALLQWDSESPKAKLDIKVKDGFWIRDGDTLVRVGRVTRRGTELAGLTLFQRDKRGQVILRLTAESAAHRHGAWELRNVERLSLAEGDLGTFTTVPTMGWNTSLTPRQFSDFVSPANALSLVDLWRFVSHAGIGSHPIYFYLTWFNKRLSLPIASFMMVLLAAPVAQSMQRQGGMVRGLAVGVVLGFLYFVTDGFVLTLGEAGALPPVIAAWSPALLFGLVGSATLVRMEGV
jgi:lipopolysaccharide export system permease protein